MPLRPKPATAAERRALAAANRARSPDAAAFVDEVRRHFHGATVLYLGPARYTDPARLARLGHCASASTQGIDPQPTVPADPESRR